MTLRLHDTATREVREFVPLHPGRVGIYSCGLTLQGPPHLGHLRKEVAMDVLRRWLERRGLQVTLVSNVTDIDDKVLAKSAAAGVEWFAWSYANERALHEAYAALGCRPPTYEPRATGHVPEMVELVQVLLERGHAYVAEDGSGDVYFDVRSWAAYGELSRQRLDEMEPALDADPRGKRDPRDFALWKGRKPEEPESASWWTPYGRGRPGWHLECSAMAGKYLGPEFDIHGGGLDLRFPHHENELAQSRAAGRAFARFWFHNALLNLSGAKMSKSIGNTLLVSEVVRRVRAVEVRYYLVSAHYRSELEFSEEALADAGAAYRRIEAFLARAARDGGDWIASDRDAAVPDDFAAAMDDDLGVPQALAHLFETVRTGNTALDVGDARVAALCAAQVAAMLSVLGLDPYEQPWVSSAAAGEDQAARALDALVRDQLEVRAQARAARDFATADAVRDRLAAAGVAVEDTPSGPIWTLRRTAT